MSREVRTTSVCFRLRSISVDQSVVLAGGAVGVHKGLQRPPPLAWMRVGGRVWHRPQYGCVDCDSTHSTGRRSTVCETHARQEGTVNVVD